MGLVNFKCPNCGSSDFEEIRGSIFFKCKSCRRLFANETEANNKIQNINKLIDDESEPNFAEAVDKINELLIDNKYKDQYKENHLLYWYLFLCKNKIKFVTDKDKSSKPIMYDPSVVFSKKKITDDEDYLKACNLVANEDDKKYYKSVAEELERFRSNYAEIKDESDPYQVFISFKKEEEVKKINPETNEVEIANYNTNDFKIANDIYEFLKEKNIKAFFSAKTLEVGKNFEVPIFKALLSAKVFILVGTKPEYVNSTWVKSEWTRYQYYMNLTPTNDDKIKKIIKDKDSLIWITNDDDNTDHKKFPSKISAIQALDHKNYKFWDILLDIVNKKVQHGEIIGEWRPGSRTMSTKNSTIATETIEKLGTQFVAKKDRSAIKSITKDQIQYSRVPEKKFGLDENLLLAEDALKNKRFTPAKAAFEKANSIQETAQAYYGLILCSVEAMDYNAFIEKSKKFTKFNLLDKVVNAWPTKALASIFFNMILNSFIKCFKDSAFNNALVYFNFLIYKDIEQREKAIEACGDFLFNTYVNNFVTNGGKIKKDFYDTYISTIEPDNVDYYVTVLLKIVEVHLAISDFDLANYYNLKVLIVDEGNSTARLNAFAIKEKFVSYSNFLSRPFFDSGSREEFENYLRCFSEKRRNEIIEEIVKKIINYIINENASQKIENTFDYLLSISLFNNKNEAMVSYVDALTNSSYFNWDAGELILRLKRILDWSSDVNTHISIYLLCAKKFRCKGLFNEANRIIEKALELDQNDVNTCYEQFLTFLRKTSDTSFAKEVVELLSKQELISKLENLLTASTYTKTTKLTHRQIIDKLNNNLITALGTNHYSLMQCKSLFEKILSYSANSAQAEKNGILAANFFLYRDDFITANNFFAYAIQKNINSFEGRYGVLKCSQLVKYDYEFLYYDQQLYELEEYKQLKLNCENSNNKFSTIEKIMALHDVIYKSTDISNQAVYDDTAHFRFNAVYNYIVETNYRNADYYNNIILDSTAEKESYLASSSKTNTTTKSLVKTLNDLVGIKIPLDKYINYYNLKEYKWADKSVDFIKMNEVLKEIRNQYEPPKFLYLCNSMRNESSQKELSTHISDYQKHKLLYRSLILLSLTLIVLLALFLAKYSGVI